MRKCEIGLSVYPQFNSIDEIKLQLKQASDLGYSRVFTSLQLSNLGFQNSDFQLEDYQEITNYAHQLNFKIHADINREIFEEIGATVDNMKKLKDLGVDVLRLDFGFSEEETVQLSLNKLDIIIEDNPISDESVYKRARLILEKGNPQQYRFCHNFFPHNDTGLDFDETEVLSQEFIEMGYSVGIFITSQSSPHSLSKYSNGVCTIEDQRYLPPHIAFEELRNTDAYDIIMFGDSYPSYRDLKSVADCFMNPYCSIDAWLDEDLDENQRDLITNILHKNRLDVASTLIRSTSTRKKVKVSAQNCINRPFGTITLDNENAERYEGELQITLRDLAPSTLANCVGMVKPSCQRLLKQVKYSGISFKIKE